MSNVLQFPSRQLKMENPTDVTFIGMQATWNSKPVVLTHLETVDYSQVHLLIERSGRWGACLWASVHLSGGFYLGRA